MKLHSQHSRAVPIAATLALTACSFNSTTALAQTSPQSGAQPEVTFTSASVQTPGNGSTMQTLQQVDAFEGRQWADSTGRALFHHAGVAAVNLNFDIERDGDVAYVNDVDPSAHFRVDAATGDFSFSAGLSSYFGPGTTMGLPENDEEAARAAIRHLHRLDLIPANPDELIVHHIGGLRMSEEDMLGQPQVYQKLVTVHFGREIDGIPVTGPGSKIVVHLGEFGRLVGLQYRWSEVAPMLAPAGGAPQMPLDDAAARPMLQAHLVQEWSEAQSILVGEISRAWYDDGRGTIEPAFVAVAELQYDPAEHAFATDLLSNATYLAVVPAMSNPQAKYRQQPSAPIAPDHIDRIAPQDAATAPRAIDDH